MNNNTKHFKILKGVPRIRFLRKISVLLVLTLITQCLYGYDYFSNAQTTDASANIDEQAPTAPTNLTVVASGAAINLSWNASIDDVGVEGYKVYNNEICIGQTDEPDFTYLDLVTEHIFNFSITAYDKSGNESVKSDVVNFDYQKITEDKQLPSTPCNVKIISVVNSTISLAWDNSSDDIGIEGYEIFKNGIKIGFTKENSFIDFAFSFERNDKYTVVAVDLSGNKSIESEAISVKKQDESDDLFEYKTDRYIVKYKSSIGRSNLYGYLDTKIINYKMINENFESITLDEKTKPNDFIESIKSKKDNGNNTFNFDTDIEYIQADYPFTSSSTDPYFSQQWGVNDILADSDDLKEQILKELNPNSYVNNPTESREDKNNINNDTSNTCRMDVNVIDAWKQTKGEGVVVAVLDTGIDITHEDLKDNIYTNQNEIPNNFIDDDGNGLIDDVNGWDFIENSNFVHNQEASNEEWHGTSVAGIIAAKDNNNVGITGIAPEAKILPLKVFENGVAYTSDIIIAIEYAEKMGAKIMNCSWGSPENNPALQEAIENSSMLFVCAAGNNHENLDISPVFPAAYENKNIITVASINSRGILSASSNYGKMAIDVAAPGEHIISTFPENQYNSTSGTSMAAAFVSGEAALILSINGDFNSVDVKQRIITSSDRLSSLSGKVWNGNKINCNNAIKDMISEKTIQIDTKDNNLYLLNNKSCKSLSNKSSNSLHKLSSVRDLTRLPFINRGNVEAVTFNDKIYVTNDLDDLYRYTPSSNEWEKQASLQSSFKPQGLVATNGKIYAIGGLYHGYSYTIEEYDPYRNAWTYRTNMTDRDEVNVAVVNNSIYIMAGRVGQNGTDIVETYEPITNKRTKKANMLTAREPRTSAAVLDGKIYVAGGNMDNRMEMYDPLTDSWEMKASMTTARGYFDLINYNDKLYAIGGRDNLSALKSIEEYDPKTNTWSISTCVLAMPRYGFSTAEFFGEIYIIGGRTYDGEFCDYVERIDINNDDYGDDFSNAKTISLDEQTHGEINFSDDVDYFKFVPTETTDYVLYGTGRHDSLNGAIYDSEYEFLAGTKGIGVQGFTATVKLQAGKTYYVKLYHYNPINYDEYIFGFIQNKLEVKDMEYVYDSDGKLTAIKNNGTIRAYFEYDNNGNLIRIHSK
ncbi:MAG: S8 family serine peptidase [Velocimicrobium sp.]